MFESKNETVDKPLKPKGHRRPIYSDYETFYNETNPRRTYVNVDRPIDIVFSMEQIFDVWGDELLIHIFTIIQVSKQLKGSPELSMIVHRYMFL